MGISEPYNLYRKLLKNNNVFCSECSEYNSGENNYCIYCGHKMKKINKKDKSYRVYCTKCGERLCEEDKFCGECGCKINKKNEKMVICSVCGEWCGDDRYCWNCGHDNIGKNSMMKTKQYGDRKSVV